MAREGRGAEMTKNNLRIERHESLARIGVWKDEFIFMNELRRRMEMELEGVNKRIAMLSHNIHNEQGIHKAHVFA